MSKADDNKIVTLHLKVGNSFYKFLFLLFFFFFCVGEKCNFSSGQES
jgi:hypothetical protein